MVLFGNGFGPGKAPGDAVLFHGQPATVAQWTDKEVVVHVPLDASSGPLVLKRGETERSLGTFTVVAPVATGLSPTRAPIGTLVRITGENFGFYSESGSTPFSFIDFNKGDNGVTIGGVPAIVYRWHDDKIDVWVPFSVKNGQVVIRRGGTKPKPDGSCCAERGVVSVVAGTFEITTPTVESYSPTAAGLDEIVTITGAHFGDFLKTAEATQSGLNEAGHDFLPTKLGEDIARSEVLFNGVAGMVVSWNDTEIKVRVPQVAVPGTVMITRGSWDLLPDGTCCKDKEWIQTKAGNFTFRRDNSARVNRKLRFQEPHRSRGRNVYFAPGNHYPAREASHD